MSHFNIDKRFFFNVLNSLVDVKLSSKNRIYSRVNLKQNILAKFLIFFGTLRQVLNFKSIRGENKRKLQHVRNLDFSYSP